MSDLDDPVFAQYKLSDDVAMAQASDIAYKHELNINANPETAVDETQKLLTEKFSGSHFIVPEFSNSEAVTIKRPNNEYIIAVRGTRPTNISDLVSDTQIAFNEPKVNRVESVKQLYKDFKTQEPDVKLTLTGHSLGAYVAHKIANEFNETFVGFNLPSSPLGILSDNYDDHNVTAKHKVYLTKNLDVISSLNKYTNFNDKIITLPEKEELKGDPFASHSIKQFLYPINPKETPEFKPSIVKITSGKNTYYSTPNEEAVRRSATRDVYTSCMDNPSLEKCGKKINKKLLYK